MEQASEGHEEDEVEEDRDTRAPPEAVGDRTRPVPAGKAALEPAAPPAQWLQAPSRRL